MSTVIQPTTPGGPDPSENAATYEAARRRLPVTYALVLELADAGTSDADVCARLGIEPEALEPLLDLARRKLRNELTET